MLAVLVPAAHAAAPSARGWEPLVLLAGSGDKARAVAQLRTYSRIGELRLRHVDMDRATSDFVDDAWEELEDFAIDDLHDLLPERDPPWRRLRVTGRVAGDRYRIERPKQRDFELRRGGARRDQGGFSLVVRARSVADRTDADDENFVMRARVGVGAGPIGRPQMLAALREGLRILEGTDLAAPSRSLDQRIARHHGARLDEGERRVLAVGYEAFPDTATVFERLGGVDDIQVRSVDHAGGYKHVKLVFRLQPDRMRSHYGELADFLDDLDDIATLRIEVKDAKRRRVMVSRLSTKTLRGTLEFYTKDGQLLPTRRRGKKITVFVAEPISFDTRQRFHSHTTASMEMLGLQVRINRLHAGVDYRPEGLGMEMSIAARKVPSVEIGGAALGFVPPGLIDVFIPSNMKQLTIDFLRTALEGNEGKGLSLEVVHDQPAPGQDATTQIAVGIEVLDNALLRLGARMVNDRVVPDEDESADIERALWDAHRAFRSDLERFSTL